MFSKGVKGESGASVSKSILFSESDGRDLRSNEVGSGESNSRGEDGGGGSLPFNSKAVPTLVREVVDMEEAVDSMELNWAENLSHARISEIVVPIA